MIIYLENVPLIKRSFLSYVHWMKKKSVLNKMPLMAQPVLFQMWTAPLNASITLSFLALHLKEQHWHRHTVILSPNKLFCSYGLKDKALTLVSEERYNYYNSEAWLIS